MGDRFGLHQLHLGTVLRALHIISRFCKSQNTLHSALHFANMQFQEFPCLPQAAKLKSGREDTQKGYLYIISYLLDVPQHWLHFLPGTWALAL